MVNKAPSVKIACIGNMNNFGFSIVRNLRDRGYDAHLFLVQEYSHFSPLADSYEEKMPDYVHQLDWYEIGHWAISKEKIENDLKGFNFFIATDLVPSFLKKAKIKLDLFSPHGSDIFNACFYKFANFPPKKYEIGAWWRSRQQRKAIRQASCILMDYTNEWQEKIISDLGFTRNRLTMSVPYIYPTQYTEDNFTRSNVFAQAKQVRAKYDLIFFHQCRHELKEGYHYKANDVMIKAYQRFVQENPDSKCLLIMFEYGTDFEKSKQQVIDLGIHDQVLWLPLMPKKDLMVWLSVADLGVGEFGYSWLTYGSVLEVLCLKKPFLGYRNDVDFKGKYPELYPMLSAKTEDEILNAFTSFKNNPAYYTEMGIKSHEWFLKYSVNTPIQQIELLIENKQKHLPA